MNSLKIKKNDTVVILSGKDKGKKGKVLGTVPSERKVVVEGCNMVTCHIKPRRQGEEGGIMKRRRDLRQQGSGRLPQVQQGYPRCHGDQGRQEGPRVQALRRRALRKESRKWHV